MRRDGFVFLEIIFGIFILGLISIVSLNLLNSTSLYFEIAEENIEIDYIAESIFENLKSKDEDNLDFLERLHIEEELEYFLSKEYEDKYSSKVVLTDENDYLWCLKVKIYRKQDKEGTSYEEFEGSIPK